MSKPVVYLLPGLMCDEAVWHHQAAALAPHAEVRIPVFRGFTSLRAMAEAVWASAPPRFSIAGHSMGARVALEVMALAVVPENQASSRRKTIEHLAVLDSGAHPVQDGEPAKRQILLDAAERKGLQAVADAWIKPMLHPRNHANHGLIDTITAMILRNTLADYQGQVRALLARQERFSLLPQIQQSVWLLCGDEDSWSPVSQHQDMQRLLPKAQLHVVRNAGHMSTMEQPDTVSSLLQEWLHEPSH